VWVIDSNQAFERLTEVVAYAIDFGVFFDGLFETRKRLVECLNELLALQAVAELDHSLVKGSWNMATVFCP